MLDAHMRAKLEERATAGNLRTLKLARSGVDFFSNDYLGLVKNGLPQQPECGAACNSFTTGSTGSRLLSGNSPEATNLEHTIAAFHHGEAAILFNSGYDANLGLPACITNRHTTILSDELIHASLIDGIRLSQCSRKYKFGHNDAADLEVQLKKYSGAAPVIVVVESVYSMDGDMAPLAVMAELCTTYGAQLIVDEAHATGVFGPNGRGLVCALGLEDKVFARVHTFGKALGCHGAAVVGSELLKKYLINFARSFIYTTALPGQSVHAAQCAYDYLASASFSNNRLHELIAYFRSCIASSGMKGWKDSQSAIQALVMGDNELCKTSAQRLQEAGLQVNPILHPTVPAGAERLRVCLHSFNTEAEIALLFGLLKR
jgi:8-amino-7-oxononanoate synthase